jgi:hypothetical protein
MDWIRGSHGIDNKLIGPHDFGGTLYYETSAWKSEEEMGN